MTSKLLGLQTCFAQHMLGTADASALLAGSPERRALGLAIYANAYQRRLVEVLADAFAKTRAMLGVEPFEDTALRYIACHTPETRNLRWYGAGFAAHLLAPAAPAANSELADNAPLDTPAAAAEAAAEMAQLDWALRQAFDGPDSPVLAAADLAGLPTDAWASLTLSPVPTTT